jgi:hypothetical protein
MRGAGGSGLSWKVKDGTDPKPPFDLVPWSSSQGANTSSVGK